VSNNGVDRSVAARLSGPSGVVLFVVAWLCVFAGHAQVKGEWADDVSHDQSFARVLVVGISPDLNQRCAFERAMVGSLRSESTQAFVSCDVMPQRSELTRETIEAAVAAKNADAVLATSLISQAWNAKEGATRDSQGFAAYKAVDSYYGVYGTVVAADFHAAAPLTSIQGEAHVTSKLYETRGATVVYTVDTKIRKVESRSEALAELTPPIAKKLRRDGLVR
jgi:hypothetical protein